MAASGALAVALCARWPQVERVHTLAEQVRAARESVLVVPDAESATLVVTGADRVTWLNGLLTCDVLKAREGEATYGLAVSQKGRVLCDVLVVKEAQPSDRVLLVVPSRVRDDLVAHLERYLIMEDVEVAKGDARVAFAHGPGARALGGIAYDPTGLGGALLLGRELPPNAMVGDDAGWEALRLERGIPRFGVDFDEKTYPQEASIEKRAVSFDKGCYLGQEVVCMLELRGHVKRKLVSFVAGDAAAIARGATVTDRDGAEVGKVSSASPSPTLGHTVGMAMVKLALAAPGTELRIGERHARVVTAPPS